jgi:hypothetical protein
MLKIEFKCEKKSAITKGETTPPKGSDVER